jgi:sec-independent protein translocase protein TatB
MFGINPMELMIILMVALIVVGPKRLPEIGRTVGRAFSELRRVQEEVRDTIRFDLEDDEPEPPTRPVRRQRSPDSPRTPSAAELASADERERSALPASEPDGGPHAAEVAPGGDPGAPTDAPEGAPEAPPDIARDVPAVLDGEPADAAPSGPKPGEPAEVLEDPSEGPSEDPMGPVELADADSPNGSPRRPARDEAG